MHQQAFPSVCLAPVVGCVPRSAGASNALDKRAAATHKKRFSGSFLSENLCASAGTAFFIEASQPAWPGGLGPQKLARWVLGAGSQSAAAGCLQPGTSVDALCARALRQKTFLRQIQACCLNLCVLAQQALDACGLVKWGAGAVVEAQSRNAQWRKAKTSLQQHFCGYGAKQAYDWPSGFPVVFTDDIA